jgi:hypothetical protein
MELYRKTCTTKLYHVGRNGTWGRNERTEWDLGYCITKNHRSGKEDLGEGAYYLLGTIRISLFYKRIYNLFLYNSDGL